MTVDNVKDNQINDLVTTEEFDAASVTTSLPETEIQAPKQDIINHLKQSNGNFSYFSTQNQERSAKIREHIQKSLSWEKAEIGVV
ncbi:MAG: hypothetical protein QNJ18_24220 [Xenococcaceae cyanobacterium MO_167.B52]|nr:hypothetical protein [Xenococcaceae cyanobacterium MO_167.B52]